MQTAVDRVMQAYVLMVTLAPESAASARERVQEYLAGMDGDEKTLTVEGLRFIRRAGRQISRRKRVKNLDPTMQESRARITYRWKSRRASIGYGCPEPPADP